LRFFIPEQDQRRRRQVLGTVYLGIMATTVLWTTILFLFRGKITTLLLENDPAGGVFWLAFIILAIDGLSFIPVLYYRSVQNAPRYVFIIFLEVLTNLGLNVLLVGFLGWGIRGVLVANIVSSAMKLLVSLPGVWRQMLPRWSPQLWRDLLRFGLPTMPAVAFALLTALSDRYILNIFFDREIVGIYAANYKIGMAMALVVTAFRFAWHPFFLSISEQSEARQTYARILTLYVAGGGFLFLLVSLLAPPVLTLELGGHSILPPQYRAGLSIIPLILLGYLFQGVYVNLVVGMYIRKRTHLAPLFTGSGVLLNLGLNLGLIGGLGFGYQTAAWAMLLANLGQAGVCLLVSRRFYPVPYEYGALFRLFLVLGLLFGAGTMLVDDLTWIRIPLVLLFIPALGWIRVLDLHQAPGLLRNLFRRGIG